MREALYYEKMPSNKVRCRLCPHACLIEAGNTGICRQRRNVDGKLMATGYGKIAAFGMDPIEKKPLFHFYPGSFIFSVGGLGCNFRCSFCQNWHISQCERETVEVSPEQLVKKALYENSIGIAFTYNEPVIWYEYMHDTAILAKKEGLKIVLVTNGFIEIEPLRTLLPYIDAMNIDVKAYSEEFYRKICGGRLESVKKVVEEASSKCHVEVTNLVIEGLNDNPEDVEKLVAWLAGINKDIPLHITRYYPNYKMMLPPTSIEKLYDLRALAGQFLNYVYVGNVAGADNNTYCPRCGSLLIERSYCIRVIGIKDGNRCSTCGHRSNVIL